MATTASNSSARRHASSDRNRKPEKTFRAGRIEASVWRNEVVQNDRAMIQYSIRIQKRYRDKQAGEWKATDYFFPDDLPRLTLAAQKAFEYVTMKESDRDDTAGEEIQV